MLQALAQLREQGGLEFTTHFIGAGPLERELKELAAKLALGESVRFWGQRRHEEIPRWMNAVDLFCLPSIREGCPNVLLEALASGKPVVASRVGGIPELVGDHNAVLVPPGEPEALAAALRTAIAASWDQRQLRESVQGFSWDAGAAALFHAALEALAWREAAPPREPILGQRGVSE